MSGRGARDGRWLAPLLLAALAGCATPAPELAAQGPASAGVSLASPVPAAPVTMPAPVAPVATPAAATAPSGRPRRITIVSTNDLHGWIDAHEEKRKDGKVVPVGGLPLFASYLKVLREENPDGVVLVDGGDLFQGTLASNLAEGVPVIEAYNALGYDAAALGNHEFDYGPVGPKVTATQTGDDPLGAIRARAAQAKFPLLAANVVEKATGRTPDWIKSSTIVEKGGVKVGIVGLATPDTPQVTVGANVLTLSFTDPVQATAKEAARLRVAGAEAIVVIAHIGGECRENRDCDGPLLDIVRELPRGTIDVAIGGHTHRVVEAEVNGVPILESGALGKAFGVVELELDPATRRPDPARTRFWAGIEICPQHVEGTDRCDPRFGANGPLVPAVYHGRPVSPDAAIAKLIEPYLAMVAVLKAKPLNCHLEHGLGRDYDGESEIGDLVTDAMLTQVPEADLAVTNSGGLRSDLPAGPLTYGHAFEVIPFDNRLAVLKLTADEVRELFRIGFAGVHGGLQVAGATVAVDLSKTGACAREDLDRDGKIGPLDRDRVGEIRIRGKPLEAGRTYTVATSDFLAGGGSGWDALLRRVPGDRVRPLDDRPILRETLVAYLSNRGKLGRPTPGRISISGRPPKCPTGR